MGFSSGSGPPRGVLRKGAIVVAPAAGANVYGPTLLVTPAAGYGALVAVFANFVSGGVFGAETVTVNLRFRFSDGSSQTFQTTFTATNVTYNLANQNMLNAFSDGLTLTQVESECKSSIAGSAATVTAMLAGVNV